MPHVVPPGGRTPLPVDTQGSHTIPQALFPTRTTPSGIKVQADAPELLKLYDDLFGKGAAEQLLRVGNNVQDLPNQFIPDADARHLGPHDAYTSTVRDRLAVLDTQFRLQNATDIAAYQQSVAAGHPNTQLGAQLRANL